MRITGITRANAPERRRERASAQAFTPSAGPVNRPASQAAIQPATTVDTLIALAAMDGDQERGRRLAAEMERGLDTLEALDAELNAGQPVDECLQAIAAWSAGLTQSDSDDLGRLQREIQLRALVELEKRRR